MNGYQIHNKTLLCKLSNATPNSPPTPTTPGHSQTTSFPPSSNLYVKNLLAHQREDELKELFEPFGQVLDVKVMIDKNTRESRQIGFVRFANQQQATEALNAMNGHLFDQSDIGLSVRYAESEGEKTSRKQRQNNRPSKPRHVENHLYTQPQQLLQNGMFPYILTFSR
jgi:RNA recognition motif-containing protein